MHAIILLAAWHFLMFTGINGELIPINPSAVVAVHISPPGYAKGTMIVTSNGYFIVRESVNEVVRSVECECNLRTEKRK
jgi:uncharacterized protein YlzI (FlbEa/FlbD family)